MLDSLSILALKEVGKWLAKRFQVSVVERWSRRRAEVFFETFVDRLYIVESTGKSISELEPILAEMFDDKIKSEVLFEAYRKVCLSASSSLGPRIIAVITARLVKQGRIASAEEERMLMVAETFNDRDLIEFSEYLSKHSLKNCEVDLCKDTEDSNWDNAVTIGPINLGENVGNWCLKLVNCGLATQDIAKHSESYKEDSERHIDQDGTLTTYTWKLVFQAEVLELKTIIEGLRQLEVAGK